MAARTRTSDLMYSAVFAGAVGSGAIALLFIAIDSLRGNPLFTPSLLGSVLLAGVVPSEAMSIRIDMVAFYSLVHLFGFTAMGAVFAHLHYRTSLFEGRPWLMGSLIFSVLTLAIWVADQTMLLGAVAVLGPTNVVLGNVVAAIAMTDFIGKAAPEAT